MTDSKTRRNRAYACARLAGLHRDIGHAAAFLLIEMIGTVGPRDWDEGGEPMCFASPLMLAERMHYTDRAVRKWMAELESAGLIERRTGARGRRSDGCRDAEGFRRDAEGIDLSPALDAFARYEAMDRASRARIREDRGVWHRLLSLKSRAGAALRRAEESALPSPAIAALAEAMDRVPPRLSLDVIGALPGILDALAAALATLRAALPACGRIILQGSNRSDPSEPPFRHTSYTTNSIPSGYCSRPVDDAAVPAGRGQVISKKSKENFEGDFDGRKRNRPTGPDFERGGTGAEGVAVEIALRAASPDFIAAYEMQGERGWPGIFAAAALLRPSIGIHESAWGDACAAMDRQGAALAVLIADARRHRGELRTNPGGFLRGMIRKATAGALNLAPTVHGLAGGGRVH